jgi:putative aldouronate transport system substrate-binding protein
MINKKIMRKITSLSMIALISTTIAGCSGKGNDSTSKNSNSDDSYGAYESVVEVSLGRTTIQNPKMPAGDTYEDNAYSRYIEEKLNIDLTNAFEGNGEDYDRQVSLAVASGELPDIMSVAGTDLLDELVENDLVWDLTEVYEKYATDNIKKIYDSYEGRALETAMYDGKLMAIPGTSVDSAPAQVWIRQDWLDKLGLKIDEDGNGLIKLEELEKVAKEFKAKDPGKSGNPVGIASNFWLTSNGYGASTNTMTAVANALGAYPKLWYKDASGKPVYGSNTPEMKQTLELLSNWFNDGILDPQFGTRTWDDITALLTNGQLGVAFGPWHIPDWLLNSIYAMDKEAKLVSYAIEDANGKANVAHDNAASRYFVVSKECKNPEVLIKMVNILFDDLVNSKTLDTDSPELVEYNKMGVDGSVRPLNVEINSSTSLLDDYADVKKGVNDEISIDDARTLESKIMIKSIKDYLANPKTDDASIWSRYHSRMKGLELIDTLTRNNSFNWISPIFVSNTETMRSNGANLGKLEEETFIKIIIGDLKIDAFDKYVKTWSDQGGLQITGEIEEAIK